MYARACVAVSVDVGDGPAKLTVTCIYRLPTATRSSVTDFIQTDLVLINEQTMRGHDCLLLGGTNVCIGGTNSAFCGISGATKKHGIYLPEQLEPNARW